MLCGVVSCSVVVVGCWMWTWMWLRGCVSTGSSTGVHDLMDNVAFTVMVEASLLYFRDVV